MIMRLLLFLLSAVLFLLHQAGAYRGLPFAPALDSYLDPLLLMPMLLPAVLAERRILHGEQNASVLPLAFVLRITASVSFICEVIFPMLSPRCTGDMLDVLCYFTGSALFLTLMNGPNGSAKRPALR
jgi:hypothetical protein